jgi:diaminopimelate decarboxylase
VLEPGRFIVGNAGVLLTRVLHVKKTRSKNFLIVDAAMNDLMRPALYDAHHPIIPCSVLGDSKIKDHFTVVGPVCETSDTFLEEAELPEGTASESLLAITVAGAYGAVMASNYNTRPMVPEALVSDTLFDQIRKSQRIEDLAAQDIVPEWLA